MYALHTLLVCLMCSQRIINAQNYAPQISHRQKKDEWPLMIARWTHNIKKLCCISEALVDAPLNGTNHIDTPKHNIKHPI